MLPLKLKTLQLYFERWKCSRLNSNQRNWSWFVKQNTVAASISVSGAGTNANIFLDQQIKNQNNNNPGNSSFEALYDGGGTYNRNCVITQPGTYTDINGVFVGSTPSGGQCTSVL